nr:zinc finger, CCHC-type [Tanacetum cinerariifolium]
MMEAKGDGGAGLYVRGRSNQRDIEQGQGIIKKSQDYVTNEDRVFGSGAGGEWRVRGTGKVRVQMRGGSSFVLDNVKYVLELRRHLISLGTLEKRGFYRKVSFEQDQGNKGFTG